MPATYYQFNCHKQKWKEETMNVSQAALEQLTLPPKFFIHFMTEAQSWNEVTFAKNKITFISKETLKQ